MTQSKSKNQVSIKPRKHGSGNAELAFRWDDDDSDAAEEKLSSEVPVLPGPGQL
jgi:hypothetical protein